MTMMSPPSAVFKTRVGLVHPFGWRYCEKAKVGAVRTVGWRSSFRAKAAGMELTSKDEDSENDAANGGPRRCGRLEKRMHAAQTHVCGTRASLRRCQALRSNMIILVQCLLPPHRLCVGHAIYLVLLTCLFALLIA